MKKITRDWFCGILFVVLTFFVSPAQAWDDLNVSAELRRPGVKLVAVEFYADWCTGCKMAAPQWDKLHKKYRDWGLRLIVVSVGEGGSCSTPGWNPDKIVCDFDGSIQERFGVGKLPEAFLFSWQGNLLASHAQIEQVVPIVNLYFRQTPRIFVSDPTDESGEECEDGDALREMVRSELLEAAKFDVVADEEEKEKLRRIRKDSYSPNYSEAAQCELGKEVSANSELKIKLLSFGEEQTLMLQLYSVDEGCMTASARARVGVRGLRTAAVEATNVLVERLIGRHELPRQIEQLETKAFVRKPAEENNKKTPTFYEYHVYWEPNPENNNTIKTVIEIYRDTRLSATQKTEILQKYLEGYPHSAFQTNVLKKLIERLGSGYLQLIVQPMDFTLKVGDTETKSSQMDRKWLQSEASGQYKYGFVHYLKPGSYTLRFEQPGFVSQEKTIEIVLQEKSTVEIELEVVPEQKALVKNLSEVLETNLTYREYVNYQISERAKQEDFLTYMIDQSKQQKKDGQLGVGLGYGMGLGFGVPLILTGALLETSSTTTGLLCGIGTLVVLQGVLLGSFLGIPNIIEGNEKLDKLRTYREQHPEPVPVQ